MLSAKAEKVTDRCNATALKQVEMGKKSPQSRIAVIVWEIQLLLLLDQSEAGVQPYEHLVWEAMQARMLTMHELFFLTSFSSSAEQVALQTLYGPSKQLFVLLLQQ